VGNEIQCLERGGNVSRFLPLVFFSLVLISSAQGGVSFSAGPHYASYLLYLDDEDPVNTWGFGGEIAVHDFIPLISLKLRGARVQYGAPFETVPYDYEYLPFSLCSSFDMLPFWDITWLDVNLETGFCYCFWKVLYGGEVAVLPTGAEMNEGDYGFTGGFTIRVRPIKHIGISFVSQFNYLASSNIYKYGYFDKDEKLWGNGIAISFISH
jgi:hypothetical protein